MSAFSGAHRWLATASAPAAALLLAGGLYPPAGAVARPAVSEAQPSTATRWSDLIDSAMLRRAASTDADVLRASADAQAGIADRVMAGPLEADAAARRDGPGSGDGYREVEGSISAVLWRRGEREALRGQASALGVLADAQLAVARLEVAGEVRAAWWSLAAAAAEARIASLQLELARELVASTSLLVEAGQQARLDLLQAQGALAAAEDALALASGREARARAVLAGLTGTVPVSVRAEVAGTLSVDEHPLVSAALADAAQLSQAARLARLQGEPAWRVGLDIRSERDAAGAVARTSAGMRVSRPLGRDPAASALAAGLEAQATAARRRAEAVRLLIEAARAEAAAHLASARHSLTAALARKAAAEEALILTERGWREGELSFLELVRARAMTAEAARSAVLASVAADAAVSTFNQAQGLLPQEGAR